MIGQHSHGESVAPVEGMLSIPSLVDKGTHLTQEEAFKDGTDYQFVESIPLGPWTSYSLLNDPKHLGFVLARYKFCARILEGKRDILEVGCGDAFGTPIVAHQATHLLAIDTDGRLIEGNKQRLGQLTNIEFRQINICEFAPARAMDGVFSIDVIEHLDLKLTEPFMENSCQCLLPDGICIVGTPNLDAAKHATHRSEVQHINLMSYETLQILMRHFFANVLMFGMNDETLHTGYGPMSHYLFAVGVGLKWKP